MDSYWQRGCENSGLWILIGTAALRIVVGGFLIRTAVKIVTHRAVFFASVHSLLELILRADQLLTSDINPSVVPRT